MCVQCIKVKEEVRLRSSEVAEVLTLTGLRFMVSISEQKK